MISKLYDSVFLITSHDSDNPNFGTGFVILQDKELTYLLTCAHVVEAVGGLDKVRVEDYSVAVTLLDDDNVADLAVVTVKEQLVGPELPISITGQEGVSFISIGFQMFDQERYLLQPIQGELGASGILKSGDSLREVKTWTLKVDAPGQLKPGYSGSPVVEKATGNVLGVISHKRGSQGFAISIEVLSDLWDPIKAKLSSNHTHRGLQYNLGQTVDRELVKQRIAKLAAIQVSLIENIQEFQRGDRERETFEKIQSNRLEEKMKILLELRDYAQSGREVQLVGVLDTVISQHEYASEKAKNMWSELIRQLTAWLRRV